MTLQADSDPPSRLIDRRIAELGDWRGEMLARVRALILEADPDIVETWKWRGVPVWEHGGIICTGETYKTCVKLTFAKGAALADPKRLFNASLEGNVRRAIDLHQDDALDASAFKALVREAIALNLNKAKTRRSVITDGAKHAPVRCLFVCPRRAGLCPLARGPRDKTVRDAGLVVGSGAGVARRPHADAG